jgi:hypothetical protein
MVDRKNCAWLRAKYLRSAAKIRGEFSNSVALREQHFYYNKGWDMRYSADARNSVMQLPLPQKKVTGQKTSISSSVLFVVFLFRRAAIMKVFLCFQC